MSNPNRIMMELDEALHVQKMIRSAKAKGMKTGLPAHVILLAGFTEGFCRTRKAKALHYCDLTKLHKEVTSAWEVRGKRLDDKYWGYRLTIEKLLENEGKGLYLMDDQETDFETLNPKFAE